MSTRIRSQRRPGLVGSFLLGVFGLLAAVAVAEAGRERIEPEGVRLRAADGVSVRADLYPAPVGKKGPLLLLFHQAGSNGGEYEPIAPRLVALGFNCLAVDQRSGGPMFGRKNLTVAGLGRSAEFDEAYLDLEAALAWAREQGYAAPLVVWGSSYTAALVFRLAAEHDEVAGLLSFSPGEYLGPGDPVRGWASRVTVPVFVTSAPGREVTIARGIFDAVPAKGKSMYVPDIGVHGSSILREDRNPGGTEAAWTAVEEFLTRGVGRGPVAAAPSGDDS